MLGLSPAAPAVSEGATKIVSVIVQGSTGATEAREAVESVGGTVTRNLPIIKGVSADVPSGALGLLKANPSVFQVSPNAKVGFHGAADGNEITHRIQKVVRAHKGWSEGITGRGVTVGLLDTGVYQHPDLAGRVICGADLTAEKGTPAECQDTFGHGTFMAGLIAGNGASSNGRYKGSAPESRIVSVKASGYDGSTDVSTILAGIQWFVAHKDQYGIRVLSLSLGSDSAQTYKLSPMNYAVERAWDAGIAVVVSAGNSGPGSKTVMKPGDDPFVITVGSSNDEGSIAPGDDRVPVFSSQGPTRADGIGKPDVVSPGVHTISLRSPGSAIDSKFGSSAAIDGTYFRGTGTSMSTATVAGAVAQMLQRNPGLSPDAVKYRLKATARTIAETDPNKAGAGLIDAYAAATQSITGVFAQAHPKSSGLGSLALDRGTVEVDVVTPVGQIALAGEFNAQLDPKGVSLDNPTGLLPYVGANFVTSGWDAASWKAASWKAEDWAAASWKAASWKATTWDAASWKGTEWENPDWDAASWKAASWKDFDWDAASWKAASWKSHWYAAAWD
jgi:serine protease AprX